MNWVGGARHRVSCHGERKLQKDFFERKRRGDGKHKLHHIRKSRQEFSQDLAALNTVDKAFIHSENGVNNVRRVDLKGYRSTVICPNKIAAVDLPPSPDQIPSKLLLSSAESIKDDRYLADDLNTFIIKQKRKIDDKNSLFSYHVDQSNESLRKRQNPRTEEFNINQSSHTSLLKDNKTSLERSSTPATRENQVSNSKIDDRPTYLWPQETFQAEPLRKYDIDQQLHTPINTRNLAEQLPNQSMSNMYEFVDKINFQNTVPPPLLPVSNQSMCNKLNPLKPSDSFLDDLVQKISTPYKTPQRVPDKTFLFQAPKKSPTKKNQLNYGQRDNHLDFNINVSTYDADSENTPMKPVCSHPSDYNWSMEEIKKDFENQHELLHPGNEEFRFQARNISLKTDKYLHPAEYPFNFENSKHTPFEENIIANRNILQQKNIHSRNTHTAKKSIKFTCNSSDTKLAKDNFLEDEMIVMRIETCSPSMTSPFFSPLNSDSERNEIDSNSFFHTKSILWEEIKQIRLKDKGEEMDEVLAELGQLEKESDEEFNLSIAETPIPRPPKQENDGVVHCSSKRSDNPSPETSDVERGRIVRQILDTVVHSVTMMETQDYQADWMLKKQDDFLTNPLNNGYAFNQNITTAKVEYLAKMGQEEDRKENKMAEKTSMHAISTQTSPQPQTRDAALSPFIIPSVKKMLVNVGIQCHPKGRGNVTNLNCFEVCDESSESISICSNDANMFSNGLLLSSQDSLPSSLQKKREYHEYSLRSRQRGDTM